MTPVQLSDLPDPGDFTAFHPFIKGVFSQWHPTPIHIEGRDFGCAEQWMMFGKATLFDDAERGEQIMRTDDPSVQKLLGAQVTGFDNARWDAAKIDIVYRGNLAKFGQNAGALRQLRNTGDAMLVEANPRDWIWRCGLAMDHPAGHHPDEWKGQNLLGRILTKVREDLSSD
jgi:ribA/ribD-fused uncharacterized protein